MIQLLLPPTIKTFKLSWIYNVFESWFISSLYPWQGPFSSAWWCLLSLLKWPTFIFIGSSRLFMNDLQYNVHECCWNLSLYIYIYFFFPFLFCFLVIFYSWKSLSQSFHNAYIDIPCDSYHSHLFCPLTLHFLLYLLLD